MGNESIQILGRFLAGVPVTPAIFLKFFYFRPLWDWGWPLWASFVRRKVEETRRTASVPEEPFVHLLNINRGNNTGSNLVADHEGGQFFPINKDDLAGGAFGLQAGVPAKT